METLKINGKDREFPEGLPNTVAELLRKMGINEATVVAEVDGQVIERENFSKTKLQIGQEIELVRFVPGG